MFELQGNQGAVTPLKQPFSTSGHNLVGHGGDVTDILLD